MFGTAFATFRILFSFPRAPTNPAANNKGIFSGVRAILFLGRHCPSLEPFHHNFPTSRIKGFSGQAVFHTSFYRFSPLVVRTPLEPMGFRAACPTVTIRSRMLWGTLAKDASLCDFTRSNPALCSHAGLADFLRIAWKFPIRRIFEMVVFIFPLSLADVAFFFFFFRLLPRTASG